MKDKHMPAHLGTSPQEYAHLGLKQGQIEQWEDGMRTDGSPNTYEWWYYDAHLDDIAPRNAALNQKNIRIRYVGQKLSTIH